MIYVIRNRIGCVDIPGIISYDDLNTISYTILWIIEYHIRFHDIHDMISNDQIVYDIMHYVVYDIMDNIVYDIMDYMISITIYIRYHFLEEVDQRIQWISPCRSTPTMIQIGIVIWVGSSGVAIFVFIFLQIAKQHKHVRARHPVQ